MSVTSSSPEQRVMGRLGRRKGQRRFSPWLLLPLALVVATAGVITWQLMRSRSATSMATTATVSRGTLSVTVSGSGTVAPAQTRALAFPVSGTIAEVLVDIGDSVSAGQPLARLDAQTLAMAVQQAEANLKSAQAGVAAANGEGATPEDIAAAESQLRSAQASLAKTRKGSSTAADIVSAQASLRVAEAQLDALMNPTPAKLSSARLAVTTAQNNLQAKRDSASATKTKAEAAMNQAVQSLTQAQSSYSLAMQQWLHVQEYGTDPLNPTTTNSQGQATRNSLNDAQRQQYYEAFVKAEAAMRSAEQGVNQARISFDNARQQEVVDVQNAEAQLADAQKQLEALEHPGQSDIVQAQAQVDQATASLTRLRQGGTKEEVAIAQASVEQAQLNLKQLTSPGSATAVASAAASLAQAQVAYDQAKLDLEHATLTAPFAGVVSAVALNEGDSAGSATTITVIDPSTLYVDLSLSESDTSQVAAGQPVTLTFDALPDVEIAGTVDRVAPTATVTSNVATYAVRIRFTAGEAAVKVGMSASGSVLVEQHADVLLAPSRAIQTQGSASVVQVRQAAGQPAVSVRVETGLSSGGQTEILSCVDTGSQCLQEGDTLLITSTTSTTTTRTQSGLGGLGGPPGGGPPPGFGGR